MSDSDELQRQVNKRLSLNLLIQGAASHTYLTGHHIVKHELDAIDRSLVRVYDKMSVNIHLAQWMSDLVFIVGFPKKFWRNVNKPNHPFSNHRFLVKHGRSLAEESKRHTTQYARRRWVASLPVLQYLQTYWFLLRTICKEWRRWEQLEQIAITATSRIWGIEPQRLQAKLTHSVKFGNLQPDPSRAGKFLQEAASGFSGLQHRNGRFQVVARAWVFPLLIHELTKGTAELVCIPGVNQLDDQLYERVIHEADKIEYEIWMMQAGGALWRKFLEVKPQDCPLAETLMHVSMLESQELENLLMDLVEHPLTARVTIADLFD